ncbi:MAG: NAD(P)/FAD-dependent oxidoreductase [Firmicutes bacterium]|nr:NAD(P)/FAD-dependent oxidoreductase [Bacillota bacterium]
MRSDLIVVGGGAAGMMAALIAAEAGVEVTLLEKNKILGRKLGITGGGRCNLTNQADLEELINNTPGNGRFLYSAFRRFGPEQVIRFFQEELGVALKVERGRRVFPVSDQAREVIEAFCRRLQSLKVNLLTATEVKGLTFNREKNQVTGVECENGRTIRAEAVVVATGGLSYPGTGSTGDGLRWAEEAGHKVVPCFPSLVPLVTKEEWPKQLEGLSLINVNLTAWHEGRKLAAEFGEMLFTAGGVSGPIVLSLSRMIAPLVAKEPGSVGLTIDLKPALSFEELDLRVQRDFKEYSRKLYKNSLDDLLPRKIIPVIIELSGIDPQKPVHQITRKERLRLVRLLKSLPMVVERSGSFTEAIVTSGGVDTKELNPKTMESKLIKGLYFAGEVVDVDAYTGGYNLQIAFSMGYVAGLEAARKIPANRKQQLGII